MNLLNRKAILGVFLALIFDSSINVYAQTVAKESKGINKIDATTMPYEDRHVLEVGAISNTQHVIGTVLAVYPGYGIGQAVQQRYTTSGWIITTGEGITGVGFVLRLLGCGIRVGLF